MFGRRCRTMLPKTASLLQPNMTDSRQIKSMLARKQAVDKIQFDSHTKELEPLQQADAVRLRPVALGQKMWTKVQVSQRLDERCCVVQPENRLLICRNGVDIWKVPPHESSTATPVKTTRSGRVFTIPIRYCE